jgi:hypothetical protein
LGGWTGKGCITRAEASATEELDRDHAIERS